MTETKYMLKDCPFCDGYACIIKVTPLDCLEYYYIIECQQCFSTTDTFDSEIEATEAWNQRAK